MYMSATVIFTNIYLRKAVVNDKPSEERKRATKHI